MKLVYCRPDFWRHLKYGLRSDSFAAGSLLPCFFETCLEIILFLEIFLVKCYVAFKFVHTVLFVACWHMQSLLFLLWIIFTNDFEICTSIFLSSQQMLPVKISVTLLLIDLCFFYFFLPVCLLLFLNDLSTYSARRRKMLFKVVFAIYFSHLSSVFLLYPFIVLCLCLSSVLIYFYFCASS